MKRLYILFCISFLLFSDVQAQCPIDLGPDMFVCANSPVVLDAGSGFVSYLWSTLETTQSILVMGPGIYGVTVTDGLSNTCSDSVFINMAPPMSIALTCIDASCSSCSDGAMLATAIGGAQPFTYLWSNGATGNAIYSLSPGTYSLTVVDAFGCQISDSCTIYAGSLGTGPFQISGNVYYDLDSSGTKDPSEGGISLVKIILSPDNLATFTDSAGNYLFLADTGIHTISIVLLPNLTLSSDSVTFTIDAIGGTYPGNDFGINSPVNGILSCNLTGGNPRCSGIVPYYIQTSQFVYTNTHSTIKLLLDTAVNYYFSNPPVSSIQGDTLIWDLPGNLGYTALNFPVYLQLPNIIAYNFYTYLETTLLDSNDVILNVCSDTINQIIACSFDPNDKAVEPEGFGPQHFTFIDQDPTLEYFVRFQNTGTDTAFKVVILDQLDPNFDISTFELIGSSHPVAVTLLDHLAEFRFDPILLPDSNVNEPGSQGYIRFRCNPLQQANAYLLENTADIYFDANPPIVTNTVFNTITLSTGIEKLNYQNNGLFIYPNPFSESTTIKFSNALRAECELSIYDITARKVISRTSHDDSFKVERGNLSQGLYFLRITNSADGVESIGKFIIR